MCERARALLGRLGVMQAEVKLSTQGSRKQNRFSVKSRLQITLDPIEHPSILAIPNYRGGHLEICPTQRLGQRREADFGARHGGCHLQFSSLRWLGALWPATPTGKC